MLGFELETSASQGNLESLAILVAIRTWEGKLKGAGVELVVQSDSTTALSLTQRLAHGSAALNFLGAELAVELERLGLEKVKPRHTPGLANNVADFLSRPSKWATEKLPEELEGINIRPVAGRDVTFYTLPPPGLRQQRA